MVFKIGLLIVLLLIIVEIDEVINSIERLNKSIKNMNIHVNIREGTKDDNKDPNTMQK